MNSQTMLDSKDFINLNDWVKSLIILNKFWSIWFIYYFIQNVIIPHAYQPNYSITFGGCEPHAFLYLLNDVMR